MINAARGDVAWSPNAVDRSMATAGMIVHLADNPSGPAVYDVTVLFGI